MFQMIADHVTEVRRALHKAETKFVLKLGAAGHLAYCVLTVAESHGIAMYAAYTTLGVAFVEVVAKHD